MNSATRSTIYALFVGIDIYPSPLPGLRGCVNDVCSAEEWFRRRFEGSDVAFSARVLLDEDATRLHVIDAFREHLCKAKAGDMALFYFCGHGSQYRSPPEHWGQEPDRLDETLVCYDSRLANGWDLVDKELAVLIAEVARAEPHVLALLDACHSASGTRDARRHNTRSVSSDSRMRGLHTYLTSSNTKSQYGRGAEFRKDPAGAAQFPRGRHIVLSACREEEEAKEIFIDGAFRGALSHYLLDCLSGVGQLPSYKDLFSKVSARVRMRTSDQSPVIEATHPRDLDRPFLGGAIGPLSFHFVARQSNSNGWIVEAGALHGLKEPRAHEPVVFTLFPFDCTDFSAPRAALGEASVTRVNATFSEASVRFFNPIDDNSVGPFKAVLTTISVARIRIGVHGERALQEGLRQALASFTSNTAVPYVIVETQDASDLCVHVEEARYRIAFPRSDTFLCSDIPAPSSGAIDALAACLEHLSRWLRLVNLSNPAAGLAAGDLQVEILVEKAGSFVHLAEVHQSSLKSAFTIEYKQVASAWIAPTFKIKITNTSKQPLFCVLLALTETFLVSTELLPGSGQWLKPGEEIWAAQEQAIAGEIPDPLWNAGITQVTDLIKLIASTDEIDGTLFAQGELDPIGSSSGIRSTERPDAIDAMLHRATDAHRAERQRGPGDWMTWECGITIVRPRSHS